MMSITWRVGLMGLALLLLPGTVWAQKDDEQPPVDGRSAARVQDLSGSVRPEQRLAYFDVVGVNPGDTLYIYVASDNIDPYVYLAERVSDDLLAENDDISYPDNLNSALSYTISEPGEYYIAVADCCDDTASGEFRLQVGVGAPEVLRGAGVPSGNTLVEPGSPPSRLELDTSQIPAVTGAAEVQALTATLSPENTIAFFDLRGMQAGQTVYAYAAVSDIDPYLFLIDADFNTYAQNDDINFVGGNRSAALFYTIEQAGDYTLAVLDCCDDTASGTVDLLVGFNAPAILNGTATPTGAQIAQAVDQPGGSALAGLDPTPVPGANGDGKDEEVVAGGAQIQEINGALEAPAGVAYYVLENMQPGDTVYAYVESSAFDTYIGVGNFEFSTVYAENDDIDFSGGNLNSSVAYTFQEAGNYTLAVSDCCDQSASGPFRLVVSLNEPTVQTGQASGTGAVIAVPPLDDLARPERFGLSFSPTDCSVLEERPSLSGPPLRREGHDFIIHYTNQGSDAATEAYIDEVYAALDYTMSYQIDQTGWAHPPRDCGEGGDDRFDLYIVDTIGGQGGILGYSSPEGLLVDNPYTPREETWSAYSHLVIDNDFLGTSRDPLALMRATTAHEFHHVVQFGYDVGDALSWYYEATATWMETQTFPEYEDATPYVVDLFQTPQRCVGIEDDSLRIYAEWVLLDSIAQDHGPEAILSLWDFVADYEGMQVYYRWLESLNTTPQEVLRRFAVRNVLLDYALSDRFGATVRLEAQANGIGIYTPRSGGVEELGASYVQIIQPGLYHISLEETDLALLLVGVDETSGTAQVYDLSGGGGVVDTSAFDYTYAVILNESPHDSPSSCQARLWTLKINPGEGLTMPPGAPQVFDASRFFPAGQRNTDTAPPVDK